MRFVLRTPALPMTFGAWAAAGDARAAREYLARIVAQPEVREALYVASPNLFDAIATWTAAPTSAAGQRVERSLVKYIARMMGRATPFGLFSAVSTGEVGPATDLALAPRSEYRRRTSLDNDYLFVLADAIARTPDGRARLRFRSSSSLYRTAGRWRYAAARIVDKERSYQLVSVEPAPYLDATIARAAEGAGATRAELAAALVTETIDADEALAYIDQLIDSQLLLPELGVHVTGPTPLDGVLAQLRAAGLEQPRAVLDSVRTQLTALDAGGVGQPIARYTEIASALEALQVPVDRTRLFQVDMLKPAAATLSPRITSDVARAIEQVWRVTPSDEDAHAEFKRAFTARYEGRTVPLCDALDEESGIGFETNRGPGTEGAPLLAGLPFGGAARDAKVRRSKLEHHMLGRLADAVSAGAREIILGDADLAAMKLAAPTPMPEAYSATIRLSRGSILFDGASGPSGARMLGRFAHPSPEVSEMVREHLAAEEALRPDAVFAEIVHLNEGRIGNILCRPQLRAHELVYLGISGAPPEQQIGIEDLLVSVRDDRIILTSRRLGKEVIPRMSTAHNYRLRGLGVYRFLCSLAQQGITGVHWTWGTLGSAPFLPRVRIGNVVVSRARWHLTPAELAPITAAVRAANKDAAKLPEVLAAVAAVRVARALPRMFAIAAGDNELPIDLDNPLLAAAFADEVSGPDGTELVELFPGEDELVAHGPEGAYSNELVLTYVAKREPTRAAPLPAARVSPALRRSFTPGSEWLYAKLYCGDGTTDRVLTEAIAPVARAAIAAGDASSWFFLRYADPDPHVRVRFRGEPAALLSRVLPALTCAIEPLLAAGAVHKVVLDTYERELERYGGDAGMELVEQIFWHDSAAVLGIIELLDDEDGAAARWKLALRGMDALLAACGLTPAQREQLAGASRDRLGREVDATTALWQRIGERFTRERADLEVVFARDPARDAEHDLQPGFELLAARDAAIAPLATELCRRTDAADLAWSLAHMHANRLLHASQRAQEMVLYDFLKRLHAARRARAPKAAP